MTVKDLVCGMKVDTETAVRREYNDETYYFCAEGCARAFMADPEEYLQEGHHQHGDHHHH